MLNDFKTSLFLFMEQQIEKHAPSPASWGFFSLSLKKLVEGREERKKKIAMLPEKRTILYPEDI